MRWVFLWLWMSYSMRMILTFLKRALMKVRACSKFQCWKTPILQSFLMLIFIFGFTLILGVQNPMHIFIACVSHWTPAAAQWQTIFTAIFHLHLFKCPLFPSILCYLILSYDYQEVSDDDTYPEIIWPPSNLPDFHWIKCQRGSGRYWYFFILTAVTLSIKI